MQKIRKSSTAAFLVYGFVKLAFNIIHTNKVTINYLLLTTSSLRIPELVTAGDRIPGEGPTTGDAAVRFVAIVELDLEYERA